MTVLQNVSVGQNRHAVTGIRSLLPLNRHQEVLLGEQAAELLDFVGLLDRRDDLASELPYGDQRRLEIARALALRPEVLLLDEPSAGMSVAETTVLMECIIRVRHAGCTVVLIEHRIPLVTEICDEVAVLHFGRLICAGAPADIQRDPAVIEAYLGED